MAANIHILNGDALAEQFQASELTEPYICWREVLVEGPLSSESAAALFFLREAYLDQKYPDSGRSYGSFVRPEMRKVTNLPANASVFLWFEDDLFCQVNMWAILWLLSTRDDLRIFRVFPAETPPEYRWLGFGVSSPEELPIALKEAVPLSHAEIELGVELWKAFVKQDLSELTRISVCDSVAFRGLKEVVEAWRDHPRRIQATIQRLLDEGVTEFGSIFRTVGKEHGIYGFGDLQIKQIFDDMIS